MKFYFSLRFLRWTRWLNEQGISLVLACIILPLLFSALVYLSYLKTNSAGWILFAIYLNLVGSNQSWEKWESLNRIFNKTQKSKALILENLIYALPFFLAFIAYSDWWPLVSMLFCSLIIAFWKPRRGGILERNTLFSKNPFEFSAGVRSYVMFFIMLLALYYLGFYVGNKNISLFALGVHSLSILSFYQRKEEYIVLWYDRRNAIRFLKEKWKHSLMYYGFLLIPFLPGLFLFNSTQIMICSGIALVGAVYLANMVFAKYASYPQDISIGLSILMTICFLLIPFSVVLLYYLFNKAKKNLHQLSLK